MSHLRRIGFWPLSGFPDRPWMEHPDEDAFVRSARSVSELYSEAVREAQVPNRHSELRLFCHLDENRDDVQVTVFPDVTEGFEMGGAALPPGVAALPGPARARLVLEVLHAAVTRLGTVRGWDRTVLDAAHAHALASGLRYRWAGPAKTGPDRRHTARPVFVLHDDGFGRVVIEVRRRDDDRTVAVSQSSTAFSTLEGFQRSARTLRWRNRTTVDLVPWAGLFGDQQGLLTLDLTEPGPAIEAEPEPAGDAVLPAIVVRVPDDAGARIEVVGGGPMNDVPAAYQDTLDELLDQVRSEPWQAWWAAGAEEVLEIWYDFAAAKPGVTVRHGNGRWRTTIRRPSFPGDPAALARADVEAMVAAVRRRAGLGEPPAL
ncbi:hypothetical protein OHA21_06420 [Actinoplanes sp. NBC_00393]|uniref:hypothetical protein n=1 Tax=Actinoplanes sp. NBC_00393 TaxID=2975953 RepID=UPI002E21259D